MAGKGGARPRAGRKAGGKNQKSREIADRAASEGITPLEVMLGAMRESWALADELKGNKERLTERLGYVAAAVEYANKAAPYIHPRLAAIEHSGKDGGAIKVENVTRRETARRLAFALELGAREPNAKEMVH